MSDTQDHSKREDKRGQTIQDDTAVVNGLQESEALREIQSQMALPQFDPELDAAMPTTSNAGEPAWHLMLVLAKDRKQRIPLQLRGEAVIGAYPPDHPEVDVSLADWDATRQGVSRRHALLRASGNARIFLIDLGSKNGTYVNGVRLGAGWAKDLNDGDLLTLGGMNLWLHVIHQP